MGKKGGGGSSNQTVTQKADPWVGVQPYLSSMYGSASNLYNNGPRGYYPGNLTAPQNGDLSQSFGLTRALAGAGSPTLGTAQNATNWLANGGDMAYNPYANGQALKDDPTANGAYLGQQNPFLRGMVESASRPVVENFQNAVAPSLASQFSAAGRMGSGAHMQAAQTAESTLGRQLGDISSGMYGNAYESERGRMSQARLALQGMQAQGINDIRNRQLQAAGLSPALEAARFIAPQQLQQSGMMQQQMQQDAIDREKAKFDFNRDEPYQRLAQYNSILSGAAPYASSTSNQSGSQSQPYNRLTGAIGGGLGGYALGSLMNMGPMGALVGGLGGLFG